VTSVLVAHDQASAVVLPVAGLLVDAAFLVDEQWPAVLPVAVTVALFFVPERKIGMRI